MIPYLILRRAEVLEEHGMVVLVLVLFVLFLETEV
jgi:hypothetical protein